MSAREGDRASFAALFERHRAMLAALCRRALGEPGLVEDAVQEATLRAMLGIAHLRQPEQFGAWLGGIGLNVCRQWIRRRSRDVWSWEDLAGGRVVAELSIDGEDPAELVEEAEVAERIRRAVSELPPGQRAAVVLFYLSGLTLAETAAQLGVPAGAVKTRLHKARDGLKQRLLDLREEREESVGEKTTPEPVEVRVAEVRRIRICEGEGQRVQSHVVLQEAAGTRSLTVWMGESEATAIALRLEGIEFSRPGPYRLMDNLLRSIGAQVREAVVERLADDVFYATIRVEGAGGTGKVDARPSDAINLALITGAPIRVAEEILRVTGAEGVPGAQVVVERGPEIAAKVVEDWQKQMPRHLGGYEKSEGEET